ncbi:acyl-CoA thioesterase YbgC [Stieleria bergensis]|uniref:Acyl-CoA thioesterase YbgC n=1 Tax=Stieleria bergensis TaxID=2528025 RepID=A0A517SZP8_9BACT|nr:acyl-CoA thioesterase YbgC [Planctomycetes bacterium SV_7m_r]
MPFHTEQLVEFRDTDAAGIAHFASFFGWMEAAEHRLLRSLGIDILPEQQTATEPHATPSDSTEQPPDEPAVTWPRINSSCQYHRAARFEDLLTVTVNVKKIGNSAVTYEFGFSNPQGDAIATGEITSVCCTLSAGGVLAKAEIPSSIRRKLETL